jgi:phosphoglucomutase
MDMHKSILLWSTHPRFDDKTKEEVRFACRDEQEALSRFGRELSFGTGGLRGMLGAGTNRMNRYTVAKATQGLADYLQTQNARSVAIAYDSRIGSKEFAAVAAGMLGFNSLRAYVFDRLMPTPMLSFAVRELRCDAGIVITASHNPAEYNGYKVYGQDGCQITDEAAASITKAIERVAYESLEWLEEEKAKAEGFFLDVPQSVIDAFIERTLAVRISSPAHPIKLVYTPLHGTGLMPVRKVFARMEGVECIEVVAQCVPDGHFPTCPKPNPELAEALALGLETARRDGADLLIATDPDCDRVGVAARDDIGEYRILTGNEVGLLLLEHILQTRKAAGALPKDGIVIKTIVTSDLAFEIAKSYGVEVREVLTGFKYIGEAMGRMEQQGEENRFIFGFEESCGYLAGTHVRDKDGVMAAMLVAEMVQSAAAEGMTLLDKVSRMYDTYGIMVNRLLNFDIQGAEPMRVMGETMGRLRSAPPRLLGESPITAARDYLPGINGLPPSDVLSYENADGCKAIVRPSGTEPKVKVYLSVRKDNEAKAGQLMDTMVRQIQSWLA